MVILCERCHERVFSQHDTNDVGEPDLFSDLEQIDALMNQLRLRRANLKRKINHRYSPIIRQLPHDVMSIVFNFCLPDYTTFHTSLSKFDLSAPLILGAVCKDWRETAWSIPKLWSAMAINTSSSDVVCRSQRSLARNWLARSGLLPLSIRVVSKRDLVLKGAWNISHLTKLSLVLHPVASRWHSFHLSAPPETYHAFCGSHFSAPNLESLHFHSDQFKSESFEIRTRSFRLRHSPRLREIRITNISLQWIRVSMANVSRIYADGLPILDCGRILHRDSLVHCELMNIGPGSLHVVSSSIPRNLKHLTIQMGKAERWAANLFLHGIAAPCLESLRVETIVGTTIYVNSLRSLVHSAPTLHTLSLGNVLFSIDSMVNVLGKIPRLKNLTVSISPQRGKISARTEVILRVIAKIIASQTHPTRWPCFPCLETVTFTGHQIVCPTKLPHAISTGPWTPRYVLSRLRSVTLKLYSPIERIPKEAIPFLLWLKDYGINLKVCDTSDPMEDLLQSSIDFYKSSSLAGVDDDDVDLDSSLFELGAI